MNLLGLEEKRENPAMVGGGGSMIGGKVGVIFN
jgi:hypothetical protein